MLDITAIRENFPTLSKMTYLNTGWSGPSPNFVVNSIKNRLEYETFNGPTAPDVLKSGEDIDEELGLSVANLINCSKEEILLTTSTTDGINTVLSGLPWRKGDRIITCDLEHPSILLPCYQANNLHGVELDILNLSSNDTHQSILEKVSETINDKTRMIFFSHIQYSNGLRMPIEKIKDLISNLDIWLMIDGAQGVGHINVDVKELGCDFYAMPGQKWLLGPDGTGALYINQSLIPIIEPVRVSYSWVIDHDLDGSFVPNSDSIDKFNVSSSSAPLRLGLINGIKFVTEIGLKNIEKRNIQLSKFLITLLSSIEEAKILSSIEESGQSGLVTFYLSGFDQEAACLELWRTHKIVVRNIKYPECLRVSLDFFNTKQEIQFLVDSIKQLIIHQRP